MTTIQKHRSITIQRLDKFVQSGQFDDVNLRSTLWTRKTRSGISMSKYSAPGTERITFEQAMKGKYEPMEMGEKFGPTWSSHWVKVQIKVPEECQGQKLVFLFDPGCESMVWSESAIPITGLTGGWVNERHIEFPLTEKATSGEVFCFFLEIACNGLFGGRGNFSLDPPPSDTYFKLETAELGVPNELAQSLFWDMDILIGIIKDTPSDSQLNSDALYLANKVVNTVHPSRPETLAEAKKLTTTFFESRRKQGDNSAHVISAIGNCHIDTAWLWPYDETKRKAARSWSRQIRFMEKYPEFKFAASQAQQFEWVENLYPKLFDEIRLHTKKGQFVPIGGTWVEMDCNIPSGEAFCRQFLYGQRYFESRFGFRCKVFWLPDTFGYSAQLPQIVKESDLDYFFTQKLSWNNINKFPHTTFYWSGLDGTKVLTHFSPADTYVASGSVKDVQFSVTNNKDKVYTNKSLMLFGNGDGGGGPLISHLERLRRVKGIEGLPAIVEFNTPDAFYRDLEATSRDVTTWHGELYFELHRGTYTSHAIIKKYNRSTEYAMRETELLVALNALQGTGFGNPKEEIDRLWKLLLLNQFHDVLPGSSIGMVYEDATKFYKDITSSTNVIRTKATESLYNSLKISQSNGPVQSSDDFGIPILNTTSWTRPSQVVEIDATVVGNKDAFKQLSHDGAKILGIVGDIPPFSLGVHPVLAAELSASFVGVQVRHLSVDSDHSDDDGGYILVSPVTKSEPRVHVKTGSVDDIEVVNAFIRVIFDKYGRIISLVDTKEGRELIPKGSKANVFKYFEDIPIYWDAWDVEVYHLEKGWDAGAGELSVQEAGPLRVILKVSHPLSATSRLDQRIIITATSPRIDFETEIQWDENRKILKVEFPVDIACDYATYETQFGFIQRPTHFNNSWDLAKFEVCGHKYVDFSEYGYGVTLLNDCKYGFAVHGNVMRMSLLRAPKAPDDKCDIGRHTLRYALLPHKGSFGAVGPAIVQAGYEFNVPLRIDSQLVVPQSSLPKLNATGSSVLSFFKVDCDHIVLDTVKLAEPPLQQFSSTDSTVTAVNPARLQGTWVLVRLYESVGGRHAKVNLDSIVYNIKKAYRSNILEDIGEEMEVDDETRISFPVGPFQIVSILLVF